ncbi:expressed protein [Chlorella variabilis]|uniref:Expressed protein n=1 Tax=Chlorella variabilis TaxID=554065 RepID=E1ZJ24_CHLVA|nr:expressed protein [Chlorella variabilis]EFN54430.1 expressed protein [Chlorella variabilis]|eukprot:XP_005846532.1 expressed protein [Chlorella variabilis]
MDRPAEASAASTIPDSDACVAHLKASLALERLRTLAIQRLEHDERLRQSIEEAVLHSRAFTTFSGEHSNRHLIGSLQAELGADLSREALRALWRVLTEAEGGMSSQIDDAIRAALCQLHAQELQPHPNAAKKVD